MGGNYPLGTYDCDPRAPWNRAEPWEMETCRTCRWLREAEVFGRRCMVCADPESPLVFNVEPRSAACENWEAPF